MSKEAVVKYFENLGKDRDLMIKLLEGSDAEKVNLLNLEGCDFTKEEALEVIEDCRIGISKNPELYIESVTKFLDDIKSTPNYIESEKLRVKVDEMELQMVSGGFNPWKFAAGLAVAGGTVIGGGTLGAGALFLGGPLAAGLVVAATTVPAKIAAGLIVEGATEKDKS